MDRTNDEPLSDALDEICVVLWEPQDNINIGTVVRACKNFGITDLRVVNPGEFDPYKISISAPKADEFIDSVRHFDTLEDALADCIYVVGTTARPRSDARTVVEPRGAARDVVEQTRTGQCAYVFGREDWGLSNEALDRCHAVVTIPTNPDYASLNLAQAVLLNLWELFRAAQDVSEQRPAEHERESEHPPADMEVMERMFEQAERSLDRIEFFKAETNEHIMRTLRSVLMRARLDERELAVWFGIFSEIEDYLDRLGDQSDEV